jgi:hypothetical protein
MIKGKLFNTKIKIERLEKTLSEKNCWTSKYIFWKDVWASVMVKDITSKKALFFFVVKWKQDFPTSFRVKIGDKIFMPTQSPVVDPSNDTVLFHAIALSTIGEYK